MNFRSHLTIIFMQNCQFHYPGELSIQNNKDSLFSFEGRSAPREPLCPWRSLMGNQNVLIAQTETLTWS